MLVRDNLKSVIVKASSFEPEVNREMNHFANHCHTTVIPVRACKPKDKAMVENQVKQIYSRVLAWLRNQQFLDGLIKSIKE